MGLVPSEAREADVIGVLGGGEHTKGERTCRFDDFVRESLCVRKDGVGVGSVKRQGRRV